MRLRDIIICFISVVVAAGLFITAGMQLDYINSERQRMKLVINTPLENAPPSLAFATVAMGAFRGLVVDVLWIRADRLKQEGHFFDAKQLAEWITTLQPRFPAVWEFHAWNMAYNISVAIPETQPEERWRWVKNGYELLRDRGILINPRSILLYRELARIFQHKIASVSDEAHKYYKLQLALAMSPLLGTADNDYFKALAETPIDFQQLISDPNVAEFVNALETADEAFANKNEKEFVKNYLSLRQNPKRFNEAAFEVIDNFRGKPGLKNFDVFAKAYQLRNEWKLDPVLMQELNQTYGRTNFDDPNSKFPMDWRHPDTHAVYWGVKGLDVAASGDLSIDETNTDRIVYHSLQNLFKNGKILIYDEPALPTPDNLSQQMPTRVKQIFYRADLSMFASYNKASLAAIGKYKDPKRLTSHQIGYRNMLQDAIFTFYQAGHKRQAQQLYNQLRKLHPGHKDFKIPLVAFVKKQLRDKLINLSVTDANKMIQMMLWESYFRYAIRDDDEATTLEQLAKQVHSQYQGMYKDENRINLPEFPMLRYVALLDFLNDPQYPVELRRNLLDRIRIERPQLAEKLRKQELKLLKKQTQQQPR